MFHVSTLLPHSKDDPFQVQLFSSLFLTKEVEKKRHIGNDICVVIFRDSDSMPLSPLFMPSKFNRSTHLGFFLI